MKVEITRKARADLIEIGDYLERVAGKRTAFCWIERLETRVLGLASHPYAGAEDSELGGRRRVVVRPYLIVYRIMSLELVRVVAWSMARAIFPRCSARKTIWPNSHFPVTARSIRRSGTSQISATATNKACAMRAS